MNKKALLFFLIVSQAAFAQEKIIDLTSPENYASQPIPAYITKDNTPADNEITDLGATLGRVLFYDKRLSRNNTVSCSSCHHQENGFSDTSVASTGVNGTTGRHSMRLINSRFSTEQKFFWDERATSLENQTTQPIQDHIEMGFSGANGDPSFADLVAKLSTIEEYQVLFQGVFGNSTITEDRVGKALSQFIRSIQSFDSKYDLGRAQRNDNQNFPNFTASENAGKQLFLTPPNVGGAGCATCHTPPEFDIDPNSRNNGIAGSLGGGTDFTNTRSPSLRDLVSPTGAPHGGFMHNASLPTLLSVIEHYNAIPAVIPGLDRRLIRPSPSGERPQSLNLTAQQKADLVDFLETLTGSSVYTDEKYSTPFNADGTLAIVVLPAEAVSTEYFTDTNGDLKVNISATVVPNVEYIFQTSPDLSEWTSTPITSEPDGGLSVILPVNPESGAEFFRFAYGATVD